MCIGANDTFVSKSEEKRVTTARNAQTRRTAVAGTLAEAFPGLPKSITSVNGKPLSFHPYPDGMVRNGKQDANMPGSNGYTYGEASFLGFISLDDSGVSVSGSITIKGYVCHASATFRPQSDLGRQLLAEAPEPNRIGLGKDGFLAGQNAAPQAASPSAINPAPKARSRIIGC